MRIRTNFAKGAVANNPLAIGGTALSSPGLATLPAVTAGDHAVIVVDPMGDKGAPEVVHVTAHAAAATTATIVRAREATTARAHALDTPWVHAPTNGDFGAVVRDRRWTRGRTPVYDNNYALIRTEEAASNPADDEFDDDTLDAAWVRLDFRPADLFWLEGGNGLSMRYDLQGRTATGTNEISALLRPVGGLVIGQSIETCVSFCGPNIVGPKWGLMFSNGVTHGSGTQVMTTVDLATTAPFRNFGNRSHVGFNATPSAAVTGLSPNSVNRTFLRLRWHDTNTFRSEISSDGITWLDNLVANRTATLTPTHMGLWFGAGASTWQCMLTFEYFRVGAFREAWQF